MPPADEALREAEERYLDARSAIDAAGIDAARGEPDPESPRRVDALVKAATVSIERLPGGYSGDDVRAVEIMRSWAASRPAGASATNVGDATDATDGADPGDAHAHDVDEPWAVTAERGFEALSARVEARYAVAQGAVDIGDHVVTRLAVLERLAVEPDARTRRRLFYALEPVWQTIDGDGGPASSPYQRMLGLSDTRWADAGLGLTPAGVEEALVRTLSTWRDAVGRETVEPWDWWFAHGAAARALRDAAPVHRIQSISDRYHASLGADPAELGIGFDVFPRPGRPPVPVAYTEFGGRSKPRSKAWVLGTYTAGGLGELTELVHETGHAIHVAAIDTRPAFIDWPDSDAFTEALAELTGMDTAEPAWQRHWLGTSVPEAVSLRDRYADIMLDTCWSLFEIRLRADPSQLPNDVWASLTSDYLGIAPHPELSWWAMRGQLVQQPGYMLNYALSPLITAALRAAVREARGDWSTGDPGWYAWVSNHIYRYGRELPATDVLHSVLGGPLTADALTADLARIR